MHLRHKKRAVAHIDQGASSRQRFWYALATYVGTIIGVGIFGLPYVAAQAGFFIYTLLLLLTAGLAIAMSLFYGMVAASTDGLHRLPGYAEIYLGKKGKVFAFMVKVLSMYGSLLALLIIGGQFLANIFDGSVYLYTFIFFLLGALLIWRDQRSVGPVELILLVVFLAAVLFLFIAGAEQISAANLSTISWPYFFIPYGVLVFALGGTSIVPEIKEMVQGNINQLKRIIITGVSLSALIYLLFALLVVGVSGTQTTDDAISGMQGSLGAWVLTVGFFFGIITTFTSFITLGLTVKKIFWYDYRMPKSAAWALACFVPLLGYIVGLRDFIDIIGLTGAVMVGLNGVVITMLFLQLKKRENKKPVHKLTILAFSVIILLVGGVLLELYFSIKAW